jgi:hypothetical protein
MSTVTKAPRRPAKQLTRLAVRTTWQPNGHIERTLTRRRVPFYNPAQIIADAARILVPEWRPQQVQLFACSGSKVTARERLRIDFGSDESGESTHVYVTLTPADSMMFASHLMASGLVTSAWLIGTVAIPEEGGDDDGETVPMPRLRWAHPTSYHRRPTVLH